MHGPLGEVTGTAPAALAVFIGNQRTEHRVPHRLACQVLEVSESWFYKWRDKPTTAREVRRGQLADAIEHFRVALTIDPNNAEARGYLARATQLLEAQRQPPRNL